jgi:ATP-dependent RNA helicase DeaD
MNSFEDIGVCKELLEGIKELGFETPMPIQEKVIPVMLEQKGDLVGLAQTGTGKTAAFGLPLIQRIDKSNKNIQAMVLSPTRELCIQITKDIADYARYVQDVEVVAIYGGASIEGQIRDLRKKPQIVVATPGRLLDLMNRKKVNVSSIDSLVLDEADEMLNMGFQKELNAILEETPATKSTYLFSATMPREVAQIAGHYMKNPIEISIGRRNSGAENVVHKCYMAQARNRYQALKRIVDFNPDIYGIIFCRTRMETKEVAENLIQDGYNADALHGDLSQAQRDYVMQKFRNKNLQMIVATDVAARGLDVNDLTHIINYNLPDESQIYTHRSGRTGRAGKKGISIAIIHQKEKFKIKRIEKLINKQFEHLPIPHGKSICEKQLFNLIDRMEKVEVDDSLIDPYLGVIYKKLDLLTKEQLIKQFVSLEFNRFLSYYKDSPDLNVIESERGKRERGERGERGDRGKKKRMTRSEVSRFFANIGKKDSITPQEIIGMINDATGRKDIDIGEIEILKTYTFFEVDKNYTDLVLKSFNNFKRNGIKVNVEIASPKGGDNKKFDRKRRTKSSDKIPMKDPEFLKKSIKKNKKSKIAKPIEIKDS